MVHENFDHAQIVASDYVSCYINMNCDAGDYRLHINATSRYLFFHCHSKLQPSHVMKGNFPAVNVFQIQLLFVY